MYELGRRKKIFEIHDIYRTSSRLPLDGEQSLFYGVSRSFGAVRERSEYSPRENPIKSAYFDTTRPPCPANHCSLHRRCPCSVSVKCGRLGSKSRGFCFTKQRNVECGKNSFGRFDRTELMTPESVRSGILMPTSIPEVSFKR